MFVLLKFVFLMFVLMFVLLMVLFFQFVSIIMDFYEKTEEGEMVEEQSVVKANEQETKMLYFQLLHLNPIKVNVTFTQIPGL